MRTFLTVAMNWRRHLLDPLAALIVALQFDRLAKRRHIWRFFNLRICGKRMAMLRCEIVFKICRIHAECCKI